LQGNAVSQACSSAARIPCYTAAADAAPKSDQKRNMSERSELVSFPDFGGAAAGTRRAASSRSLFFAYFLWRGKESKWPPGYPG